MNDSDDPTARSLEFADELRQSLGELIRAVRAISDDLSVSGRDALRSVAAEPQTVAALARVRMVKHQSMSATIADLEERGLVVRERDPADRRVRLVSATDTGRAALERGRSARTAILAEAMADLPAADRRALTGVPALLRHLTMAVAERS